MTSKEAFERIKKSHHIAMMCLGIDKPDIETEKAIEKIEKDLEILEQLEILKKHYSPFKKFLEEMFEKGYNEDLVKIKEWLENDDK